MNRNRMTDAGTARQKIGAKEDWFHRIEVAPGVVTPGVYDSQTALAEIEKLGLPANMEGQRILDLGCRDGFFSFEMERRGAEVVAVDYAAPETTGFPIARELLGSNVEFRCDNVYEVTPERYGRFDIVLFLGLIYHLRNPMLAIDRARSVTKEGGLVFVETEVTQHWLLKRLSLPIWHYFPGDSLKGDATNKWAPNLAGLVQVLFDCELEVEATRTFHHRAAARCRATDDGNRSRFRRLDASKGLMGTAF